MKRLTALILTAVMVFGMIPASLLPAWAHGTGVGVNGYDNISIDNAPNQAIPATVKVDGIESDSAWDHDDWQNADAGTGIWDAVYYRSSEFGFKYQLHTDYQYLYGIVVLDTKTIYKGTLNNITVWLNSDDSVDHYTAKMVFDVDITGDTVTVNHTLTGCDASGNETALSDPAGTMDIEKFLKAATVKDGVVTLEFRCLTKVLAGSEQKAMTAYVSAGVEYADADGTVVQNLYHPRFDTQIDASGINPASEWPANASVITQREIYALPNGDYSKVLPNEMIIDGKLTEGVWAPYTTMYTEGLDRYEYRNEDFGQFNDATGFDTVDFDTVKYNLVDKFTGTRKGETDSTDCPIKYKYDIRYDANYLYGAVIAYCDLDDLKNSPWFNGEGYAVSMWLTLAYAKKGSDGQYAIQPGLMKIQNYAYLHEVSTGSNQWTLDNDKTTVCTFNDEKITGGSRRISDYLVEFEFAIPMSKLIPAGDTSTYGYIIDVNIDEWNGSSGDAHGISEVATLSSMYNNSNGIDSVGNTFCRTTEVNTEGWSANGSLETGRWTAIKAADNKVDSGSRNAAQTSTSFDTEHMAYEVFTDDDYLYGIAIIEDKSWVKSSNDSANCFNIWINNGVPRWHDFYDNKLSFMLDSNNKVRLKLVNHYVTSSDNGFYNGAENMLTGIYDAYDNPATALAALRARGFLIGDTVTSLTSGTSNAAKWLINEDEEVITQGVEAVMKDITPSGGNTKLILEFKVPLEMLCITERSETGSADRAFTYVASIGDGEGRYGEMVHPMMSNRKVNKSGGNLTEKVFNVTFWNAHECNTVYTTNDYTNNVADGKLQEAYWDTVDELIKVDGETGSWQKPPVGEDYVDYYYRVYTSREWLYGSAVINDAANPDDTKFTLWYNNDVMTTPSDKASGRFEIYLGQDMEPVCDFYDASGNKIYSYTGFISDGSVLGGDVEKAIVPFTETIQRYSMSSDAPSTMVENYGYGSMKTINGVTYVEFKINLDKYIADHEGKGHTKFVFDKYDTVYDSKYNIGDYYIEPRENIQYVVSVGHESNTLFHLGGDDYEMWITGVNDDILSSSYGGGYLINQNISDYVKRDNWSYILFYPTEIENVYMVADMNWLGEEGSGDAADLAWTEWSAKLANLPEGAFVYKISDYKVDAFPEHLCWSWNEGHEQTGMLDKIMVDGRYIRFTNFNPYGTTVEEAMGRLGNANVPMELRGYATDATFTPFAHPGDSLNDIQEAGADKTHYPDKYWTFATDHEIVPLQNFVPEKVQIDGYLNDSGWDDNKWIEVSNNVNGNLQNPGPTNTTPEFEYKYQIRSDGEYVYIAALMDIDPEYNTATNGWQSSPQFRIWIQSEGEGYDYDGNGTIDAGEKFDNAISFTHLFDVRLGSETDPNANSTFGTWQSGNVQSTITVDKYSYNNVELPFNPVGDSDVHEAVPNSGVTVTPNGDKLNLTFKDVTMRFATHINTSGKEWWSAPNGGNVQTDGTATTKDQTKGFGLDSIFWGETQVHTENTKDGKGSAYSSSGWYASPEVTKYTYGAEHAAFNTTEDGSQTVVEFKFALSDIGTDAEHGFKYYVQCSSIGSTTSNAYVLFHPNYTVEPDNGTSAYSGYYLPFWVWGENAIYCDEQWFYDNALNNPKDPVAPLGSQFVSNYTTASGKKWTSALRFGVLYSHEYVDDVYGRTSWKDSDVYENASYWDIKEIGMVVGVSSRLKMTADNDVDLYTETSGAAYVYSDYIIHQKPGSNMADYETYIFYAVVNASGNEDRKFTYRGVVEYYPSDDIYYDYDWIPGSKDTEEGFTFRPTYYSNPISRTYNMVKEGYDKYGVNGDNMPDKVPTPEMADKVEGYNGVTVAYIPIDNRPVNYQRVQYLAQSVGINLLMPPEEYFTNTLDNDDTDTTNNTKSDSGNPLQLLNWLKTEAADASYYVLSLDMLFSGGLIGSRAPEVDKDYDDGLPTNLADVEKYTIGSVVDGEYVISAGEQAIIDYLVQLAAREDKYVVYFDTVIRLASTTYYGDYAYADYVALRSGFADKARVQLYGDDLTMESIFAGYNYDETGAAISDGTSCSYTTGGTTYTTNKIQQYLANRMRKLTLIDTLLTTKGANGKSTAENIEKIIIGADDSKPQTTIQTNELRYIEEKLLGGMDNAVVMAAADELGQLGLSDVTTEIYGDVNVNVTYFGSGKDEAADDYDRGTLSSTVKAHVKAAGGYYDYNRDGALEILILTKASTTAELVTNVKALLTKAQENIDNNIPTCIVDASDQGEGALAAHMFGVDFKSAGYSASDLSSYALSDVSLILGYSEWNTVANALGISISNAIARYAYLQNSSEITAESNYGFMKNITHAYVKDIAYREFGTNAGEMFYKWAPSITDKINASEVYVGEIGTEGSRVNAFTEVKVSDLYWPWDRHFEADFNITFSSTSTGNVVYGNNNYTISLPTDVDEGDFVTSITDGVAQNATYDYGNDANWNRFTTSEHYAGGYNSGMYVNFTMDTAIEAGYVRVHLLASDETIASIKMPDAISVYGSNDNVNFTALGTVKPTKTADYNMPDGNTYPGTYYPFWPEATYVGPRTEGSTTTDIYGTWVTIPLNGYSTAYKYIRIYFVNYGTTYYNEIEIYKTDSGYDPAWILSGEKVYGN